MDNIINNELMNEEQDYTQGTKNNQPKENLVTVLDLNKKKTNEMNEEVIEKMQNNVNMAEEEIKEHDNTMVNKQDELIIEYDNIAMTSNEQFSIQPDEKDNFNKETEEDEVKLLHLSKVFVNHIFNNMDHKINELNEISNLKEEYEKQIRILQYEKQLIKEELSVQKEEYENKINKIKLLVKNIQYDLKESVYDKLNVKEKTITELKIENERLNKLLNNQKGIEIDYKETVSQNLILNKEIKELQSIIILQENKINDFNNTLDHKERARAVAVDKVSKLENDCKILVSLLDDNKKAINSLNSTIKNKSKSDKLIQQSFVEKDIQIKQIQNFAMSLKGELKLKEGLVNTLKMKVNKLIVDNEKLNSLINTYKQREGNILLVSDRNKLINQNYNHNQQSVNIPYNNYNSVTLGNTQLPPINTNIYNGSNNIIDDKDIGEDDQDKRLKELSTMMKKILDE